MDTETKSDVIEVTPEMLEAGADAILSETGGAGAILCAYFDSAEVAARVYRAMENCRRENGAGC
jgi:hypothetical protein